MSFYSTRDSDGIHIWASPGSRLTVDIQTGEVFETQPGEEKDGGYICLVQSSSDDTNNDDDEDSE